MGKSGKIAKVYKLENQWTIDSNLEVVKQEGLDKPLPDFRRVSLTDSHFQKEGDILLIKKRKVSNFGTLEERLEATAVGL